MELQVSARPARGCTIVQVSGELDMDTRAHLKRQLEEAIAGGVRHVVLDLREVAFMDSSGLCVLVDTWRRLLSNDGMLYLAEPQDPVRNVLVWSTMDQVLGIFDTVAAAEEAVPG